MSLQNLENTTKKLGAVYTRKLKKGQKDPFRLSLQAYSPQTFAQDLGILKKEIKALRASDSKINVSSLRDRFNQMDLGDVSVKKFGNNTDFLVKFENKDNKKNIIEEIKWQV